jgi:hypothetical protein
LRLNGLNATDSRADGNATAIWIAGLKVNAAVLRRFNCRCHTKLAGTVSLTDIWHRHKVRRVKIRCFAGDSREPLIALLKGRDCADARPTFAQAMPQRLSANAKIGYSTKPRNDDAFLLT